MHQAVLGLDFSWQVAGAALGRWLQTPGCQTVHLSHPCSKMTLITQRVPLSMQRRLLPASMPNVQVTGVLFPILIGGGAAYYFFGREHRPRHSSADAGSGQVPSWNILLFATICLLECEAPSTLPCDCAHMT